jgi:hypothetical protein
MPTKSQKVSGAVLGLAVIAFAVDRWVISSGEIGAEPVAAADSRTPAPAVVAAAAAPGNAPEAKAAAAEFTSLASRLAAMSEARRLSADSVADAFRPSEVWLTLSAPPAPPKVEHPGPKPAPAKVDHAAAFVQRHTLTAVMKDRSGGMAIINGKLYKVGQYVGGFKLTRVGLTDASFWGKGTGAKLKLAGQFPTADAR